MANGKKERKEGKERKERNERKEGEKSYEVHKDRIESLSPDFFLLLFRLWLKACSSIYFLKVLM